MNDRFIGLKKGNNTRVNSANPVNESQVVVKKISNPPLITAEIIHKFVKLIMLLIIIGFSIKGLLIVKDKSYEFLQGDSTRKISEANTSDTDTQTTTDLPATIQPQATTPDATTSSPNSSSQSQTTPRNSSSSVTQSPPSQTSSSSCGVAGMPQGVCTTIQSIEANGVKGNPNVEADTSLLPDGVKVDVNEPSWQAVDASNGKVGFTMFVNGTSYNGTAILQLKNGTWKVINYYSG